MKVWPVLENELKWRKPCHKSTSPQVALESDLLLHSLENSELPSSEEEVKQSSHISRPVEHHGAKLREETRERGRYTKAKLLMDCGLNPEYLHHSPAVQKVTKKAQEFRAETLVLKQKLERSLRRNGSLKHLAKKKTIDTINELLISPAARQILEFELKNFLKKPQGRRWTLKDKQWCLAIYRRNVSVYRFLCTLLTLPSVDMLRALTKKLIIEPGFNIHIFKCLEQRIKKWSKKQRTCVIMFDEMSLQKGIYVNSSQGFLDGFENYGHLGRTSAIATHALTFVLRGLHSNWKVPIGYFLTKNTVPTEVLAQLLPDAIKMCQSIGLNVVASISDQGATNRGAISMLRDLCDRGEYEPVYEIGGATIVHLFDTPHLLKNIRNNFMVANVKFGKNGNFLAKWGDIIKYQSLDVLKFGKRSGLTHDHLYPTGKLKMRVKFAAQTMSYSVASAMCSIVVASEGRHLSDSLQTAKFIHDVDLLFDICNGPGPKDKVKSQRCNVAEGSIHHALWRKLYASMKNWKFLKKVTNKKGEVSIKETVPPCVTGWMDNIKGFQRLWTICKSLGFSELNLRRLNSDPVENLYSIVRQTNGANRNPTCIQFESSLKTALVNGMSHFKIKGKNCSDDDSVLLSTEEALFGGSRASEASNLYIPENRTIMVRGKPEYLQSVILNDKCTRLAPAVQCNIVVSKVLKEEDFKDCLTCKNALVATNPSSDHILSANLNNNLNCFENEESVNYAEALKCTSENLKNPQNNFSSPELLHNFIICQKKFLTDCSSFLYLNNCSDLTKELISITFEDFDWLCSEHQGSLKLKLVSCIAECFLNQLCRSINKYLRDSIKRKNLLSKLKAKKVAVVLKNNQVSDSDPDWVDMSEEEAASLINFLLDKNDLQQTGNFNFVWIYFNVQTQLTLLWIIFQKLGGFLVPACF